MKGGLIVYRCRRCGAEIKEIHVPQLQKAIVFILTDLPWPEDWEGGIKPDRTEFHLCGDGNIGIMDLLGGEFD